MRSGTGKNALILIRSKAPEVYIVYIYVYHIVNKI